MDEATETVFADPSGRRRRLARTAGIAVGCLLAAYLAVVATGLLTGSDAPLTPWPGTGRTPQSAPPARGAAPVVHPAARHPSARPSPSPRPRTTSATATPQPTPSTSVPGHGRGRGLTKSPNPRKPGG